MKFYKKIAYKIKCLVPALGIAGVAMLPSACQKPDPVPEKDQEDARIILDDEYNTVEHTIIMGCTNIGTKSSMYIAQNQR